MAWKELPYWVKTKVSGIVLGYRETRVLLRSKEEQVIMMQANKYDPIAVRSGRVLDPTVKAALQLEKLHRKHQRDVEEVKAVDKALREVLSNVDNRAIQRALINALIDSFMPRSHNVSYRYDLGMSERNFWYVRNKFASKVAEEMGWL